MGATENSLGREPQETRQPIYQALKGRQRIAWGVSHTPISAAASRLDYPADSSNPSPMGATENSLCLLYTSDAADDEYNV